MTAIHKQGSDSMGTAMDIWINEIKEIMEHARLKVANDINQIMIETYWKIGQSIIEHEQGGELKAEYGKKILTILSKRLTNELGKGYSKSNLYNMRGFYTSLSKFSRCVWKIDMVTLH